MTSSLTQSALIGFCSFLILFGMAALFLYFHLKGIHDEVLLCWKGILEKMRLRNDMIPNLVETVRKCTREEEKLLNSLVALKSKSWPLEESNGPKANAELSLSDDLHAVWRLTQKFPQLNLDTNFLALKKDFRDLGKEIDEQVEVYNKKLRAFNKNADLPLIGQLLAAVHLKKFQVFEFEA
jgi:hypothetical protein